MIVNVMDNSIEHSRFGWTIPKYVGSAVTRNKFKRWCRDICRKARINNSKDINIVLRKRNKEFYKEISFDEFQTALKQAFKKIN